MNFLFRVIFSRPEWFERAKKCISCYYSINNLCFFKNVASYSCSYKKITKITDVSCEKQILKNQNYNLNSYEALFFRGLPTTTFEHINGFTFFPLKKINELYSIQIICKTKELTSYNRKCGYFSLIFLK